MCGRFTLRTDPKKLAESFQQFTFPAELAPRYNIAPSQPLAVVANNGSHAVDFFQWGLVPAWAKDPKIGHRMINARSETLAEKNSFKAAFKRRRCLIFADGFYEWHTPENSKQKTPYYIKMASDAPFVFAGLWESWTSPDGDTLLTCTIITGEPNEVIKPLHHRMAVILPPDAYDAWLDPAERTPAALSPLLKPYPANNMVAYPVTTMVNNPRHDDPACIAPVQTLL